MLRRSFLKSTALATIATLALAAGAHAENPVLKIGFVGVTSGPAAAWGISNQRSMETRAAWLNELVQDGVIETLPPEARPALVESGLLEALRGGRVALQVAA